MLKKICLIILFLNFLISSFLMSGADFIIFSYDRPMQLYAFLESAEKYVKNLDSINIIYRVSNSDFELGYKIVKDRFINTKFYKQEVNDKNNNFKELLLKVTFNLTKSDYLMYGVDDMIVTDYIDINDCIKYLEQEKAYGFFLRLGKNIIFNYTVDIACKVPELTEVNKNTGVYSWKFNTGTGDWGLPASTDMSIYRKKDCKEYFKKFGFINPNQFEDCWINSVDKNLIGLCYEFSKNINIPLNIVQDIKSHRSMNLGLPKDLLEIFLAGFKIDIFKFEKYRNKAPHEELFPEFIER